jgi:hypothetical protein
LRTKRCWRCTGDGAQYIARGGSIPALSDEDVRERPIGMPIRPVAIRTEQFGDGIGIDQ